MQENVSILVDRTIQLAYLLLTKNGGKLHSTVRTYASPPTYILNLTGE